ncbi:hypothetical protein ACFLVF_00040 [Chloroflexota bacterium]
MMRKTLYLYLAIACFLALLAIFVVDGYMGIYDTVKVTASESEQTIEPDTWVRQRHQPSVGASWGTKIFFTYKLENRRFSSYATPISASVWQEQKRIIDMLTEDTEVETFGEVSVEWVLDSSELESRGFTAGQYTVIINREGAERSILIHFNTPYPPPPQPVKRAS